MALVVKNPPDNAGNIRNSGLFLGSRRSPGVGNATHSSILAWNIPQRSMARGYSPRGHKELDMTEVT